VDILATSSEKILSLIIKSNIQCLYSCQVLVESLSDEVASLVKDGEDHFKITRSVIQNLGGDWKHFLRKAVYTYKVVKGFP
jgi:hypothetical protein